MYGEEEIMRPCIKLLLLLQCRTMTAAAEALMITTKCHETKNYRSNKFGNTERIRKEKKKNDYNNVIKRAPRTYRGHADVRAG